MKSMPLRPLLSLRRCARVQDFAEVTFPHLAPVCTAAKGDALLLLTRHADVFAERLPRDPATRVLLPLLARAADEGLSLGIPLCLCRSAHLVSEMPTCMHVHCRSQIVDSYYACQPTACLQTLCAGCSKPARSSHADRR